MPVELKVPEAGESIVEVQVGQWLKGVGDRVERDETVVVLETDKAALELPAPASGILRQVMRREGESSAPGEVIGIIALPGEEERASPEPAAATLSTPPTPAVTPAASPAELGPAAVPPREPAGPRAPDGAGPGSPAGPSAAPQPAPLEPQVREPAVAPEPEPKPSPPPSAREEEVVPMSPLRRRIAERLVAAHQSAALLTTFNEVEMSAVQALRREHQDAFHQRHGVKLGIMSFFVKAAVEALRQIPQVNAEVRDAQIVYRRYYDIGIAVGSGRGLVVPVLHDADRMSFADIERAIDDFARRAQENRLKLEELEGGTFTITNGGIYGSLLSTPIVNPPQSGILGLHAIQERPVARDGAVVIRPMMYVALTYDHRVVDGREAVLFLRRIKECIEAPARLLLEA